MCCLSLMKLRLGYTSFAGYTQVTNAIKTWHNSSGVYDWDLYPQKLQYAAFHASLSLRIDRNIYAGYLHTHLMNYGYFNHRKSQNTQLEPHDGEQMVYFHLVWLRQWDTEFCSNSMTLLEGIKSIFTPSSSFAMFLIASQEQILHVAFWESYSKSQDKTRACPLPWTFVLRMSRMLLESLTTQKYGAANISYCPHLG